MLGATPSLFEKRQKPSGQKNPGLRFWDNGEPKVVQACGACPEFRDSDSGDVVGRIYKRENIILPPARSCDRGDVGLAGCRFSSEQKLDEYRRGCWSVDPETKFGDAGTEDRPERLLDRRLIGCKYIAASILGRGGSQRPWPNPRNRGPRPGTHVALLEAWVEKRSACGADASQAKK